MATKKPESSGPGNGKKTPVSSELELVRKAGLKPLQLQETSSGKVVEISPAEVGGKRTAALFPDEGVDVVVEVEVSDAYQASSLDPDSIEAQAFVGRLSIAMGADGIAVSPSTDDKGVTTILLRAHRCKRSSDSVSELADLLNTRAQVLTGVLAEFENSRSPRLEDHFNPQVGALDQSEAEGEPLIAPTMDPSHIQRLYELSERLQKQA